MEQAEERELVEKVGKEEETLWRKSYIRESRGEVEVRTEEEWGITPTQGIRGTWPLEPGM